MRQTLSKALVESPTLRITNCLVDLRADEDTDLEATVKNRQGVIVAMFDGPFSLPSPGNIWQIETAEGPVTITRLAGCGCGGTLIEAVGSVPA